MLVTCKYLSACLRKNIHYDQSMRRLNTVYRAKTYMVTDCNEIYTCREMTAARCILPGTRF